MHPVIVFDLDGTLVDSLPDILSSFLHAFEHEDVPAPDEDAVRRTLGQPLETMYAAFAPAGRVDALCRSYRAHYAEHLADRSRPFPGVPELLALLRERGYLRTVASTKRTVAARRLVEATGLGHLLDHVEGTDAAPYKPAPDVVLRSLAAVGGRGVWMVGDTVGDIRAGRAAGLKTYAVTWGTQGADELATSTPDRLEPDLTALASLL
jgi:phosphoglycolate phosphatase